MKDNLIINDSIYIMDCPIKQVGGGLFWRIPETAELSRLLKDHHIVFTTLQSKYYTGKVSLYRTDASPSKITLCLEDLDGDEVVRKKSLLYAGSILIFFEICVFLLVYGLMK
jgi:hypothetical protein